MAVQQVAQLDFPSPRSWINKGLARYLQVRYVEQEKEHAGALRYLSTHRDPLIEMERQAPEKGSPAAAARSLINSSDEFCIETKAMNVWWMLRELVGETALTAALHNYNAGDDKDALYMQKLLEQQSHRDLTWFFDDWVYRDRGLPDFRIDSVHARPVVSGGYMVTVTVENLGGSAGEVPVKLEMTEGEATEKLIVPGKSKASVRILAATTPTKVIVNDGSVPESIMSNNEFTISAESLNQ
jgi:aminopeptidase N